MELQLRNIGMIKEATVKIDGLTVIAGENDTGKSTVGKALFMVLKASLSKRRVGTKEIPSSVLLDLREKLFKNQIEEGASLCHKNDKGDFEVSFMQYGVSVSADSDYYNLPYDPIYVETPLVWDFADFFRDVAQVESEIGVALEYPYLMKDLNFKLHIKSAHTEQAVGIEDTLRALMKGEFKKDDSDRYYFYRHDEKIELVNTATGIKTFGILQVLSHNRWLNKDTVLILDEPEVHLHPKWQLEMAKIIVKLVKDGVKVIVNSHSPYMIEALKRYSDLEKIESQTHFYLAEGGYIKQENDNNAETLERIFETLSEPFEVFDEMDSKSMESLIHG